MVNYQGARFFVGRGADAEFVAAVQESGSPVQVGQWLGSHHDMWTEESAWPFHRLPEPIPDVPPGDPNPMRDAYTEKQFRVDVGRMINYAFAIGLEGDLDTGPWEYAYVNGSVHIYRDGCLMAQVYPIGARKRTPFPSGKDE